MRLEEVQQEYGAEIELHWRTFPLIADHRPGRLSTEATRESRQKAAAEEPRAGFVPPDVGTPLPASSVPALTAAKSAERQGPAAFAAFHRGVFAAFFRDNLDIGRADVLRGVAETSGLDLARFDRDCADEATYQAVLHDYAEAVAWFGVSALPTVVFNERLSLVGAVPADRYRVLVDWYRAGAPGSVIPLDLGAPAAASAIQAPAGAVRAPADAPPSPGTDAPPSSAGRT